jgi:transcriptional regulator with XRE-family HTH domain
MKEVNMIISERIFKLLSDKKMTQREFASQVGIATSTVSEWKKKKTNPNVEKIMDICAVLEVTPEQLLTGKGIDDEEEVSANNHERLITPQEKSLLDDYHNMQETQKKRLLAYVEALKQLESLEEIN